MPATLELLSSSDTILTLVTFQAYGAPWYKLTGVMHNTETLHRLDLLEPTEKAEVVLRGQLEYDGEMVFATALACEYPVPFGCTYAVLSAEAIESRRCALLAGRQVPGAEKWRTELHLTDEMLDIISSQDLKLMRWYDAPDHKFPFVLRGGGAPSGLSEVEHLFWGIGIGHPLQRGEESLDPDLVLALEFECEMEPSELDDFRTHRIDDFLWRLTDRGGVADCCWATASAPHRMGAVPNNVV